MRKRGSYLGGSTILHAAGAAGGTVEEARRGERTIIAAPAFEMRGRASSKVHRWIDRDGFKAFLRSVRKTRQQEDLNDKQASLIDAFLAMAEPLLHKQASLWGDLEGAAAIRLSDDLRRLWAEGGR
ncbi:hypothetical protein ACEUZ9_002801 [Paracoccus litorisediminis]|uniref:hypothetical protein n=1 Tax=Paracoccus litorisediminis TaxID=2006130 RepID=UPI0037314AC1